MEEGGRQKYNGGQTDECRIASTEDSGILLEKNHVYSIYDQIAPHFNEIRHKAWPNVKKFLRNLDPGSLIADIGCGNGRYLKINNDIFTVGLDRCSGLLECAGTQGQTVIRGDNLYIPFRDDTFDAIVSVGVIHHFATVERRVRAVRELARILRPGGKLLIYVWAFEQKHRRFDSQDVLVPWHRSDNRKQNLRQGSSSSDRDLSSTSSLSEDDATQDLESHNASLNGCSHSISPDNVFLETSKDVHPVMSRDKRARMTNGLMRSKENRLVLECRKLEASLKALLTDIVPSKTYYGSKKHHTSDSVLLADDSFDQVCSKGGNSMSGIIGYNQNTLDVHQTDDLLNSESNLGERTCVNDKTGLNALKKHCVDAKNLDDFAKQDLKVKLNHGNVSSDKFLGSSDLTNSYCQNQTHNSHNSFFQLLKNDFLAFFEGGLKNVKLANTGFSDRNYGFPIGFPDPGSSDDDGTFAVREFPLSSCPAYRNNIRNSNIQNSVSMTTVPDTNGIHTDPLKMLQRNNHYKSTSTNLRSGRPDTLGVHRNDEFCPTSSGDTALFDTTGMRDGTKKKQIYVDTCHKSGKTKMKLKSPGGVSNSRWTESVKVKAMNEEKVLSKNNDIKILNYQMKVKSELRTSNYQSHKKAAKINSSSSPCNDQTEEHMNIYQSSGIDVCHCHGNSFVTSDQSSLSHSSVSTKAQHFVRASVTDKTDISLPENVSEQELCRYYHVFRDGELLDLISQAPCLSVVSCSYDHANWCVVAEKLK